MYKGIQIIESISFARLQDIIQFQSGPSNSVSVLARKWEQLPMNPASGDLSVVSRREAAGDSYTTSVTARLSTSFNLPGNTILLVKLCSGKELIVGTPDIPVVFTQNTTLTSNVISISHVGWIAPMTLVSELS